MSFFDNITNDILQNIFSSWKKCKDNHIYLENIYNTQITCDNIMSLHNILQTEINKKSVYFDKCMSLDISIQKKFNNILLVNCSNINLYINNGLISGLNIINCNNINIILSNKIDFTELSNSENCNYIYNPSYDDNTIFINTNNCFNINLDINNIKYLTNSSYFGGKKYFLIHKDNISCIE